MTRYGPIYASPDDQTAVAHADHVLLLEAGRITAAIGMIDNV